MLRKHLLQLLMFLLTSVKILYDLTTLAYFLQMDIMNITIAEDHWSVHLDSGGKRAANF